MTDVSAECGVGDSAERRRLFIGCVWLLVSQINPVRRTCIPATLSRHTPEKVREGKRACQKAAFSKDLPSAPRRFLEMDSISVGPTPNPLIYILFIFSRLSQGEMDTCPRCCHCDPDLGEAALSFWAEERVVPLSFRYPVPTRPPATTVNTQRCQGCYRPAMIDRCLTDL